MKVVNKKFLLPPSFEKIEKHVTQTIDEIRSIGTCSETDDGEKDDSDSLVTNATYNAMYNFCTYCSILKMLYVHFWNNYCKIKLIAFTFYVTSEDIPKDEGENLEEIEEADVSPEDHVIDEDNSNDYSEYEPKGYELPR